MEAALNPARLPAFDHPLEALKDCHAYLEEQVARLRELAGRSHAQVRDPRLRQLAASLIRYFDTAARLHYEDEERDLFPSLTTAALGPNAGRVALLVRQVEQQHRAMDLAWMSVKGVLARIARGEPVALEEIPLDRFVRACCAHSALTRDKVIPLAALVLDTPELEVIGRSMAERRGVPAHPAPCTCAA